MHGMCSCFEVLLCRSEELGNLIAQIFCGFFLYMFFQCLLTQDEFCIILLIGGHQCRDANLWRSKIWRFFFYKTPIWNHPSSPQEDETSCPSNWPWCTQVDVEFPMFTLTLPWEKGRRFPKSSEDFLSWPKFELKSSDDFRCLPRELGRFLLFTKVFWRQMDF